MCSDSISKKLKLLEGTFTMRVIPKLAKEVGLIESILLLQFDYLVSISNYLEKEKYWIDMNITNIRKYMFPFIAKSTFYRALDKMIKKGYILSEMIERKYTWNSKNFYTLNYKKLGEFGDFQFQGGNKESHNETISKSHNGDKESHNENKESQGRKEGSQKGRHIIDKKDKEEDKDIITSKEVISQAKLDLLSNDENNSSAQKIFEEWSLLAIKINGLTNHKSINSKVRTGDRKSTRLSEIINKSLLRFSLQEIISSIRNYGAILTSDEYYYDYKFESLGIFLTSKKGLEQFLSNNDSLPKFKKGDTDPVERIHSEFDPLTEICDRRKLLDENKQTYFGFPIPRVKNPRQWREDLDYLLEHKHREFVYRDFSSLELIIASLLFSRKATPQPVELTKYFGLWLEHKPQFSSIARKALKEKS